jgi:CDGSH iron-sulfur domain-containing protein 3
MSDPVVAQKTPLVMTVEPGKYAWCACGRSANQPYCDGGHKGTGITPHIETVEETRKVAWCGCKQTGKPPFCDGSHSKL